MLERKILAGFDGTRRGQLEWISFEHEKSSYLSIWDLFHVWPTSSRLSAAWNVQGNYRNSLSDKPGVINVKTSHMGPLPFKVAVRACQGRLGRGVPHTEGSEITISLRKRNPGTAFEVIRTSKYTGMRNKYRSPPSHWALALGSLQRPPIGATSNIIDAQLEDIWVVQSRILLTHYRASFVSGSPLPPSQWIGSEWKSFRP